MNDPAERLIENEKSQSFPHKQIQRHLSVRHGQKDEKGDESGRKTEKNVLKKTAFSGGPIQQAPGAKQFIIYPYPASQSHGIQKMQKLGFSAYSHVSGTTAPVNCGAAVDRYTEANLPDRTSADPPFPTAVVRYATPDR